MKPSTPMGRTRAKKRAAQLVPYEAWVHKSNYTKLLATVKMLQTPAPIEPMVTTGYFTLTPEQRRFEQSLKAYPRLYGFWDFSARDCNIKALTDAMGVLSSGERVLAEFYLAVWTGDTARTVDLMSAARLLELEHRSVIIDWLTDPYFP